MLEWKETLTTAVLHQEKKVYFDNSDLFDSQCNGVSDQKMC